LCGLAAAGLSDNHNALVGAYDLDDAVLVLGNRQLG
jgi:hypothetical protein